MSNAPNTFTAEFTAVCYEPRAKNHGRLVTCTKQTNGDVRVTIECEAVDGNCRFVTLSDEVIPAAQWETVRGLLKQTSNFKVVKRG